MVRRFRLVDDENGEQYITHGILCRIRQTCKPYETVHKKYMFVPCTIHRLTLGVQ